jgi:hypothetical protein
VLFFVETPCSKLQKAACDCRLAREQHGPRGETRFTSDDRAMNEASRNAAVGGASSRVRSAHNRR